MAVLADYATADMIRAALGTSDNAWALLQGWKVTNGRTNWDTYVSFLRTATGDATGHIADVEYTYWRSQAGL